MTKTKRCPRCWDGRKDHDWAWCASIGEAIDAGVERAKVLGLSTSHAAAMAGGMAAYVPVEQLRAAVLAAVDAWGSLGADLQPTGQEAGR